MMKIIAQIIKTQSEYAMLKY